MEAQILIILGPATSKLKGKDKMPQFSSFIVDGLDVSTSRAFSLADSLPATIL